MSGKHLEKIKAGLPSRKNPRNKVTSKQKAQRSFSIPRKQRKQGSSTTKQIPPQVKTTNYTNECSDSSTNISTVDGKTTTESDLLLKAEWGTDSDELETSESVEQMRSSDAGWVTDGNKWETSQSVEQMRSSELVSLDEFTIAPPMQFRDSEFYPHLDGLPISSTPLSLSKQKSFHFEGSFESIKKDVPSTMVRNEPQQHIEDLDIPDVSYIRECDDENDTLKGVISLLNSISPEQSIQIPPVPEEINKDSLERIAEVPSSDGFEVSNVEQNFDAEDVEQNFDAEDVEQNFDAEDVEQNFDKEDGNNILKRLQNDIQKGSKHYDEMGSSFEDLDNQNSGDILDDNQNIQTDTPKKKGQLYRGVGMKSNSRMGRLLKRKIEENSFEDMNKRNNQNSFQNVQNIENEKLQLSELNNNQEETAAPQRKRKYNKRVRVAYKTQQNAVSKLKRSQISTLSKSKHTVVGRISFEDTNNSDNNDCFEIAQNIQDKDVEMDKFQNKPLEISTCQAESGTNKRVRVGKNKHQDVGANRNGSQNLTTLKKNMIEERNSLEDMNSSNNKESIENMQNIQNEQLQVNELDMSKPETATQRKARKFFKHPRSDSKTKQDSRIKKRSQNSSKRRKVKAIVRNSTEDIYTYNSEDSFDEGQNTQTDAVEKKRKNQRGSSLGSKSRNAAIHFSASQNSQDLEVTEQVQNSQSEGKKLEWPLCCLSKIKNWKFTVLKPVIRGDFPIDSITLMCLEKKNEGECMH